MWNEEVKVRKQAWKNLEKKSKMSHEQFWNDEVVKF
jgi:hypothetical protein